MSPVSGCGSFGRSSRLLGSLFLILSALLLSVRGDHCLQLSTCGDCISSHFRCKWCTDVTYNGTRCVNATTDGDVIGCRAGFEDPKGSATIEGDKAFSSSIQLQPQHFSLQLRPGVETSFEVKVKPAPNFPLDVYFLMDFSQSMRDNLAALRGLSYGIVGNIRRISRNFRVGFGSFVDKKTVPMMGATFWEQRNPCLYYQYECEKTYSYHHHLSLTGNEQEFYNTIQQAETSGNFDPPEGGADALLQAIVCTDVVGWRPAPARRMLVYISDAEMHFSYDGKLGGVVTPHDGLCHTSRAARYSDYLADTRLDYPSLSMIIAKLQEFQIYPVFAVSNTTNSTRSEEMFQLYQNISANIPFSTVERVSNDSSNIHNALRKAYLRIASSVRLSVAQGDLDHLDVRFEADCSGSGWTSNDTCGSVLVGDEVSFRVSVKAKECTPELRNGSQLILSSGFFGSVVVDVKAICECNCSKTLVHGAEECNGFGAISCGTCLCDEGRYGRFCECGAYDNGTIPQCPVGPNGEQCSGPLAGECSCGECYCNRDAGGVIGHRYFGAACECNNFECNKDTHGKMCSGHGTCECGGVCECDNAPSGRPYTGEICECYPDDDVCRVPTEDVPCSGHGSCECGLCKCQPGYGGDFCQSCINREICGPPRCSDFSDCISCLFTVVDTTLVRQDQGACLLLCNGINVTMTADASLVATLRVNSSLTCSDYRTSQRCNGPVYYVQGKGKTVFVEDGSLRCSPVPLSIPQWLMVVPIVVGLLLIGVAAIIAAKLIIVFMDYREYMAWKEDLKTLHFPETENPLYKSAWQTFYCPMYPGYLEQGLVGTTSAVHRAPSLSSIRDDEDGTETTTVASSQQGGESPPVKHRRRYPVARLTAVDGRTSPSVALHSRDAEGPSIIVAVSSDSDSAKSEDQLLQECNIEDLIQSLTTDRYNSVET